MSFEALMKKKKPGKPMDPDYKASKMGVLKGLYKDMGGLLGDELKSHMGGLKKVTVAAPDKAGLSMGLDKAEDMLKGDCSKEESSELPEMEASEGEEGEAEESSMSPDELLMKIKELQSLLEMKMKK